MWDPTGILGALSGLINAPQDAIKGAEQSFASALDGGMQIIETTEGNIVTIVKDTETNVVTVLQDGISVVRDTEQNIGRLVSQAEKGVFDSVAIGEVVVARTARDVVQDGTVIATDVTRGISNFGQAVQRSGFAVVDDGFDKVHHIADSVQNNWFNLVFMIVSLSVMSGVTVVLLFGEQTITVVDKTMDKVITVIDGIDWTKVDLPDLKVGTVL